MPGCQGWWQWQDGIYLWQFDAACVCEQNAHNAVTNAGGKVTGTLTGLLSEDDSSEHSIIDDTGSESTHISKGITDDGLLLQDDEVAADLSDETPVDEDTDSDASNF